MESARQLTRSYLTTLVIAIVALVHSYDVGVAAPSSDDAITTIAEKVRMSDGIHLATNIYLSTRANRTPTVLIRTPYNKEGMKGYAMYFAKHGYSVVVQDVRGKYGSEGNFMPFLSEEKDGLETVEWIVKQRWSSGEIAIWGPSYLGFTGLILLDSHAAVKVAVNINGVLDMYEFIYPGGNFHLMAMLPWIYAFSGKTQRTLHTFPLRQFYEHLPLNTTLESLGINTEFWKMVTQRSDKDDFYRRYSVIERAPKIQKPILHVAGFNDWLYEQSIDLYQMLTRNRNDAKKQRLIIGPWGHNQELKQDSTVGDYRFGKEAIIGSQGVLDWSIEWFDHWLKDKRLRKISNSQSVTYFIMGLEMWQKSRQWPPTGAERLRLYLDSDGEANSIGGTGQLVRQPATVNRTSQFIYDPSTPVETVGGVNYHMNNTNQGIRDQRYVEQRKDVLVFTSKPLAEPMTLAGPITATLYVSSDGKDADFTVKLVVVEANGYARIVEDGVQSLRYRLGKVRSKKIYRLEVELGHTALRVMKDQKLRVEISSSNFPKYARNPSTGEKATMAKKLKRTKQRVYHGKQHPSHIEISTL